jgi:hypothetical protein
MHSASVHGIATAPLPRHGEHNLGKLSAALSRNYAHRGINADAEHLGLPGYRGSSRAPRWAIAFVGYAYRPTSLGSGSRANSHLGYHR